LRKYKYRHIEEIQIQTDLGNTNTDKLRKYKYRQIEEIQIQTNWGNTNTDKLRKYPFKYRGHSGGQLFNWGMKWVANTSIQM